MDYFGFIFAAMLFGAFYLGRLEGKRDGAKVQFQLPINSYKTEEEVERPEPISYDAPVTPEETYARPRGDHTERITRVIRSAK